MWALFICVPDCMRLARFSLAAIMCSAKNAAPTLESRVQGAFFGALVADALSLGTHYEYDAKKIKKFYGKSHSGNCAQFETMVMVGAADGHCVM